jgi:hypothetical protein
MNYQVIKPIDNKELQKKIKIIDDNILIIDTQIRDITTKLNEIQNFTTLFQKKNNLYNNENNIELKMQVALLSNEKEHITNMKKIFITNLFNELYDVSNNIILLISSFLNLEFNENINSSEILKKLVRIKQITTIRMPDIYESVTAISKNLVIIYDTLHEFNEYIETMGSNIKTNNYHCSNIYTSLKHKYSFIMLEYGKYYDTLNNIIPFYQNLSFKINKQLSNKYVLFNCLNDIVEMGDINDSTIIKDRKDSYNKVNNFTSNKFNTINKDIEGVLDIDSLNKKIFSNSNISKKIDKENKIDNKSPSIVSPKLSECDNITNKDKVNKYTTNLNFPKIDNSIKSAIISKKVENKISTDKKSFRSVVNNVIKTKIKKEN